jgi:hypothetical protein
MYQPSGDAGPLPVTRAFVVQLYAAATAEPAQFAGRVEHVASGRSTHFASVAEFLAFLARVLAELGAAPPAAEC